MPFTASQIAEQVRGEVIGDGSVELTGLAPADCARSGDLTFAEKESYFAAAEQSQASAIPLSATITLIATATYVATAISNKRRR